MGFQKNIDKKNKVKWPREVEQVWTIAKRRSSHNEQQVQCRAWHKEIELQEEKNDQALAFVK
jgi:hypothetical protein